MCIRDRAYPSPERTPSSPSTHAGIKHAFGHRVSLRLNDREVEPFYYNGRDISEDRTKAISRWRGLPLQDGRNVFIAEILDETGALVDSLREEIWYVKTISRATALPENSTLIADGRTPPVVAIRLEDQSGRPVHAGRVTEVKVCLLYTAPSPRD